MVLRSRSSDLDHVVYIAVNLPTERDRPLVAMTYSPDWQKHYAQRDYVDIDPVVAPASVASCPSVGFTRPDPPDGEVLRQAQEFRSGRRDLGAIRGPTVSSRCSA